MRLAGGGGNECEAVVVRWERRARMGSDFQLGLSWIQLL